MKEEILIAGAGGQGILFIGQLIAQAAIIENKQVTWLPSYGPAMRGGKANCAVIISDNSIGSPIVESPNTLIAMNAPSLVFATNVVSGGLVILNSSLVRWDNSRNDLRFIEIITEKMPNISMLGAYIKERKIVKMESVLAALENKLKEKKELFEMNKKILLS